VLEYYKQDFDLSHVAEICDVTALLRNTDLSSHSYHSIRQKFTKLKTKLFVCLQMFLRNENRYVFTKYRCVCVCVCVCVKEHFPKKILRYVRSTLCELKFN